MDKQHISLVEAIYREHKDHIYNYIQRMCNDPELSHDIVHATFIKLLSDPKIADVEYQKAYLFTIARNALFDEMKRKKPVYFEDSEQVQDAAGIDDAVSLQDGAEEEVLSKAIDKAIGHMPDKFRELMLLRYIEDLSIQEIADITERKLSDIKVNLHRARLAFENRFTATMYSKVAASRKRCDILIGMIAPFGESDIPMPEIPKIEKHIAQCVNCNEDATAMKRRRELFALLPILIAPSLWDDIMKEAQAGTLSQDTGAQAKNTQGSEQGSTIKAANNVVNNVVNNAVSTAVKVSTIKMVVIAAIIIGVVVSGFILSKLFMPKLEKVPEDLANPVLVTPPTPQTPPTQPALPINPAQNTANVAASGTTTTSQSLSSSDGPASTDSSNPVQSSAKPQSLAKLTPPVTIAPTKTPQTNPSQRKPTQSNPDKKKASGIWWYDGPPITAIEEQKIDVTSANELTRVYLSKLGMRALSKDASGR